MIKALTVCFTLLMLATFAASAETTQQKELFRLLDERSRIVQKLMQQQSPEEAESLQKRLKKIDDKLGHMGIDMPIPPEPSLSQVDRAELGVTPSPPLSLEGKRYRFDISTSPSFNNNYFQSVEGSPQQSIWLNKVSSGFQLALVRNHKNQLTVGVDLHRNFVRGIDNADWSVFEANLNYATPIHQLAFRGFYIPQRLTFTTQASGSGLARTSGLGVDYIVRFTPGIRARLFYRLNDVRYRGFDDRDLKAHRVAGDIQFRLHNLFIPGVGYEWTNAMAQSENYTYREITPVLLLGARLGRVATLSLRYRYKLRNYPIGNTTVGNFGRKDRRHDAYIYISIRLGRQFDLTVFHNYLQNISTRAYRGFTTLSGGATLQFRFPGQ